MGFKDYVSKKMFERQLKDLPPQQKEMFKKLYEKNPKLFEDIAKEIQERKKKGQDERLASIAVMRKYESQLRSMLK